MNIYVGNLSYDVSEESLRQVFGSFGQVTSAKLIKDKYSGQSRGFGFVEMLEEAQAAIKSLNEKEILGQTDECERGTSSHKPGKKGKANGL